MSADKVAAPDKAATPDKAAVPDKAATPGAKPAKSKKKLMLIIAGAVLLAGGGGAYYAFSGKGEAAAEVEVEAEHGGKKTGKKPDKKAEKKAPKKHEEKLPPQFVALDPPFVVNFAPGSSSRFLQISVQLMTRDPHLAHTLEQLNPIIRNDLLLLFGHKQVEEVSSQEGKEALRSATLQAVRKVIADEGGDPEAVESVYFTSFVMQ